MNRRKETKGLIRNEVLELHDAWAYAAWAGYPLNLLITFRPELVDGLSALERCLAFTALRNKLGVCARGLGFVAMFIWSREVDPDGTGEHMHVVIHVPPKHRARFEANVRGWFPGPEEVDVRRATQHVRFTADGKRLSIAGYLTKQSTPQAWFKSGLLRKAGGPILGKRAGVTRNLSHRTRPRNPNPIHHTTGEKHV